ncbi:hypothetical protein EG327_008834 [Venturia inaequalis]|uniref:Uncharacterized protein n=1 Tax=Venturia inaequalis TaxID=5025 RepID=A0A8H3YUN9_VENIN|nr:hypothetical protein EG327_008834 [Venturia inaequalis]
MSESNIGKTAMGRTGFRILLVLCLVSFAGCYFTYGANYAVVSGLLGVAYLLDLYWTKVLKKKINKIPASTSNSPIPSPQHQDIQTCDEKHISMVHYQKKVQPVCLTLIPVWKTDNVAAPASQNKPVETSESASNNRNAQPQQQQQQQQTSASDDYWDDVYRQCVEQKRRAGGKPQTRRRRG